MKKTIFVVVFTIYDDSSLVLSLAAVIINDQVMALMWLFLSRHSQFIAMNNMKFDNMKPSEE